MDKKKVVLAYPLYGYEWRTGSDEYGAKAVKGWSAMASYKRVKELLNDSRYLMVDSRKVEDTKELGENMIKLNWERCR
jgi:hypothetical protein